ncbi:MAG: C-methyltransferase [Verrucomicrobiales bacterium]|nr:C-methyltransferase [Verrucomicrobiales bacterium]
MIPLVTNCRICRNDQLDPVLDLGDMHLSGVFPKTREEGITHGRLELVKCRTDRKEHCGLVQLRQSYNLEEMYGQNYGYRSSLNRSMVQHLESVVAGLRRIVQLEKNDLVLDIGSNDGTLLSFYPPEDLMIVGFDPTSEKFKAFYRSDIHRISDFFSAETFQKHFGDRKAKIVTSIAMFYDLESPLAFMQEVRNILAPDGLWFFEQSYLPLMLERTAYDTICHEHREYYAFQQIKWMTDRAGLKIVDVSTNDINGGSFAVTVARQESSFRENVQAVKTFYETEELGGFNDLAVYKKFEEAVLNHKEKLYSTLENLVSRNKRVLGYGASTKGNVILQFCRITTEWLPAIAEVNADKFGAFTPGTLIPIISEREAHQQCPDYFLVFPWHFRSNLLQREAAFLKRGGKMIFPLPQVEIIGE